MSSIPLSTPLIPTKSLSKEIDGIHTELNIQSYSDRVLVLITQLNKVGCFIQASLPPTAPLLPPLPGRLPEPAVGTVLTPLFGAAPSEHLHDLYSLYASQVAVLLWTSEGGGGRKPVVVGVALQRQKEGEEGSGLTDRERKTFEGVMRMVQECFPS
ncbi:hypothetical protein DACRYDRAFT_103418 [Dacryopinax primogenitus]|uniref:Proteasome assembly chaperone 3 n=1 Tax=Dacryopinax primogenitus (strain DJM 731) TaxID=1858805 RepID=M5GFN6_DACPD|nr:uncharacterized protein DACRYDRAFT_103418 [Dacryopinax primogenitus]EJU06472.1 hypothetical protein DACRYDRAFT_103418 [Dacryopinax primogenitus]